MQAIGQLAGRGAQHFNNILTSTNGHPERILQRVEDSNPLQAHGEEIEKAAHRAAGLTRQLLAFSRKQVLQPKVINLNTIIADMQTMLQRLLGENVKLVSTLHENIG